MEAEPASAGWVVIGLAGGLGSCLWSVMILYNIGALIGVMRDKGDEASSALSKAAWAVGFFSLVLGPCAWLGALVAMIMANVERRRIFSDKSTFASATPCRHASVNGGFTLLIWFIVTAGALAQVLM